MSSKTSQVNFDKFQEIYKAARDAAAIAVVDYDLENPVKPGQYPLCGFGWVTVTGRGSFITFIKEYLRASKNYTGKGYNIWYSLVYDCNGSQDAERHMTACVAFAAELKKHGISCYATYRLD